MNTISRPMLLTAVLVACSLGGCGSGPKGSMSEGQLATVRTNAQEIRPGQKKSDVLAKYPGANLIRLSSTRLDGAMIEEWKSEAFHDSGNGRDLFVQFLYFRNDTLVDVSDSRLDFHNDPAIVKRWAGSH